MASRNHASSATLRERALRLRNRSNAVRDGCRAVPPTAVDERAPAMLPRSRHSERGLPSTNAETNPASNESPAPVVSTHATVYPGDSGGPLFNLQGEVIAIHSNIGVDVIENRHVPVEIYQKKWDDFVQGKEFGEPADLSSDDDLLTLALDFIPQSFFDFYDTITGWFTEDPKWYAHAKDSAETLSAVDSLTEPDEADALAHVPVALRFPAPGLPKGHVVLPYDERGHCPMLVDGACSIYEHRPRTCRTYDCRIFAVTGVVPDQPAIATRVLDWQFEVDDEERWEQVRDSVQAEGPPIQRALRALRSGLTPPPPPGSRSTG